MRPFAGTWTSFAGPIRQNRRGMSARNRNRRRTRGAGRPAPPRDLEYALLRRNLARKLAEPLADRIEEFSELFSNLARRRVPDRAAAAARLTVQLAAWGGLAAGEDRATATELFGVSVLLGPDDGFGWHALALAHLEEDVAHRFRDAAGSPAQPGPGSGAQESLSEQLVLGRLGRVAGRLRAHEVDARAVLEIVRDLVALQLDTLLREEPAASAEVLVATASAAWLLDVPTAGPVATSPGLRQAVFGAAAESLAADVVELRRSGVDAEEAFQAEGQADEDEEGEHAIDELEDGGDDDEATEFPLGPMLRVLDDRLRVTEDPADGAMVAHALGGCLLAAAAAGLAEDPVPLGLADRVRAASWVAAKGMPEPPGDLDDAQDEWEIVPAIQRAAAHLAVDQPPVADPDATVEQQLRRLDELVEHCSHSDVLPSECAVVDGLAYSAAATEALRVGVALCAAGSAPCNFAGALAVLDPSALAAYPKLRTQAADELRDFLARGP